MNIHRIRTVVRTIMAIFGLSFTTWILLSMQARDVDPATLESNESVLVEQNDDYITFKPASNPASIGVLFYPGALVDPKAYVPLMHSMAAAGYEAVIVKVPYRLDMQKWQKNKIYANTLSMLEEQGKKWVLAGHSRGARRALEFVSDYENKIDGLILIGTSHPREQNHSRLQIPVVKVYASNDGLASLEEVEQYKVNLPEHTQWILIEGGNHAQFGWYGNQFGDEKATISRTEQQNQLLDAMRDFLADY